MIIRCPLLNNKLLSLSETDEQLIWKSLNSAPASMLAGLIVGVVAFVGLYGEVHSRGLTLWLVSLCLMTGMRYFIISLWRSKGGELRSWGRVYLACTFMAGLSWASLILLNSPSLPLNQQLIILVLLIGMPMVSIPANAIYLSFYYAFSIPIPLALLYWALFVSEDMVFVWLALAYFAMLLITSRIFHNSMRQTIDMRFENLLLIEQLSASNLKLEKIAYLDPLTGMANRRWFQERAEEAFERCKRRKSKLALMLIDIDKFKEVNDSLGHEAGDQLLIAFSERLSSSLRQTDVVIRESTEVARYGGDEFIVLVEDVSGRDDVKFIAQRMLEKLREPVLLLSELRSITVSIGAALVPDHADGLSSLTRVADIAMYQAKQAGRNQYRIYKAEE